MNTQRIDTTPAGKLRVYASGTGSLAVAAKAMGDSHRAAADVMNGTARQLDQLAGELAKLQAVLDGVADELDPPDDTPGDGTVNLME